MPVAMLTEDIWPRLRQLAKRSHGKNVVAVPFVGPGAARRLPLKGGDVLVTRFSRDCFASGTVDPREIAQIIKRGVDVHRQDRLHAKVYVLGRVAVVGSANLSSMAELHLIEAACEIRERGVVSVCRDFVNSLTGDLLELPFVEAQIVHWRPPRMGRSARASAKGDQPIVAVALDAVDMDDDDKVAARNARSRALQRMPDRDRFKLDSFFWTGKLPEVVRVGGRVLMCTREANATTVSPPGHVVAVRRYRGGRRSVVVVALRKRVGEKRMGDVLRGLGRNSKVLKALRSTRVIRGKDAIRMLGRLWPRATT